MLASVISVFITPYILNTKQNKFVANCSAIGGAFLIFPFLLIKKDSTLGRILIYKISLKMFEGHWLYGIGLGGFSKKYLLYQAAYFESGKYSSKELLLADNTYYAFNDYFQWIIECGVLGIILLAIAAYFVWYVVAKLQKDGKIGSKVSTLALFTLLVMGLSAAFTYTFHIIYFQLLALSSLGVLYLQILKKSFQKKVAILILMSIILLLAFFNYKSQLLNYQAYKKLSNAKMLSNTGFKHEALDDLRTLYPDLKNDSQFLWFYGKELLNAGYVNEANDQLKLATDIFTINDLYADVGECLLQKGEIVKAEGAFLISVNMVPNRFNNRFMLYQFYQRTNQINKAKECAHTMMSIPVKVQSKQVDAIKSYINKSF